MSSTAWYVWHKRVSGRNQATKLSLQNLFVNWRKKTFLSRVRECFYSSDRFVEFLRWKPAGGCGGGEGEGKERTTPVSYGLNCVSYSPQSSSEIKSKMLHHTFLYISFPSLLDYDVKMPWKCLIFVLWRTVNKLLFSNLSPVPRSQLQGNSPTFHIFSELE